MKPNAEPVASDRPGGPSSMLGQLAARSGMLAVFAGLICGPALAGDRASIDLIGYSSDLSYFAFEEFGIQDGSGFAYSNVYVVDLERDEWVVGTPIRVQADEDGGSLAEIRAEAAAQAEAPIAELDISLPAEFVALIGDGMPDQDGQSLAFGVPGYWAGDVVGRHQLSITSFAASAASPCEDWFSKEPLGFALQISDEDGERQVHRDEALPRSRGCPFDYRIHGVVMPFMAMDADSAVAIISVYPGGFEGPDRRFLAVPLGH